MSFLCDTNVVSELAKPRPHAGVVRWMQDLPVLFLSAISVEEMSYGLQRLPAGNSSQRIRVWLEQLLDAAEILPITADIARRAGHLRGRFAAQGQTRSQADLLIAATAQLGSMTVVTRNTRDFEGCQVPVFDPFD